MSKIYTKTGDQGETGLFGGGRVRKDAPRIEAYGTVDELNSLLGIVRSGEVPAKMDQLLERIQNDLFSLGAYLATPDAAKRSLERIDAASVTLLEEAIDEFEETLPPLNQFILPGGTPTAAHLHTARTVCRRAERAVVGLGQLDDTTIVPAVLAYINRLSDLLFVLARSANSAAGKADVYWQQPE